MEAWRKIAIAEVEELAFLLKEDPTFTAQDLGDRLRAWLEYIELGTWKQPHEAEAEWWNSDDIPTAADLDEMGAEPQPIVYPPTPN